MSGELPYRVFWSRPAIDALKEWGKTTRGADGDRELAQIVRTLDERLRREPLEVGEIYRARGVVQEHLAVYHFIAIDFAVDRQRRFVLVRVCRALSRHGP